jgi:hypothetical protein
VGNALAAAPAEPVASFAYSLFLLLRLGFIIQGDVAQGGGYRIEHGFLQSDQSGKLRISSRQSINV